MESSIAVFLSRRPASELLPTSCGDGLPQLGCQVFGFLRGRLQCQQFGQASPYA